METLTFEHAHAKMISPNSCESAALAASLVGGEGHYAGERQYVHGIWLAVSAQSMDHRKRTEYSFHRVYLDLSVSD